MSLLPLRDKLHSLGCRVVLSLDHAFDDWELAGITLAATMRIFTCITPSNLPKPNTSLPPSFLFSSLASTNRSRGTFPERSPSPNPDHGEFHSGITEGRG